MLLLRHGSLQVSYLLIQQFPLLSILIVFVLIALVILVILVIILVIIPFLFVAQCKVEFCGEVFVDITLLFGFFPLALFTVLIPRVKSKGT